VIAHTLSGRGEPHRPRAAVDEREPELGLQRRDVVGDHGLRVSELERRCGERPPLGDLMERAQTAQIVHRSARY
jgi:hypothetical protein